MMVIQGQLTAAHGSIAANTTYLFPADRCAWVQETNRESGTPVGYNISTADFIPGNGAALEISDPLLGFIGKSGRFVEIA